MEQTTVLEHEIDFVPSNIYYLNSFSCLKMSLINELFYKFEINRIVRYYESLEGLFEIRDSKSEIWDSTSGPPPPLPGIFGVAKYTMYSD
jgi:hypothetical protein